MQLICVFVFAYYDAADNDTSLNNVNIMGETYLFSSGNNKKEPTRAPLQSGYSLALITLILLGNVMGLW